MTGAGLALGLILGAAHLGDVPQGVDSFTPGVYVRGEAWAAGAFRNSWAYPSVYVAHVRPCGPVECVAGLVTGYAAAPAVPLLGVTRAAGPLRLSATLGGSRVVVLSVAVELSP